MRPLEKTPSATYTCLKTDLAFINKITLITAASAITEFSLYNGSTADLGSEKVSNGYFSSDTVWTKGANWAIAASKATHTAGATEALSQDISAVAGEMYQVVYTVSGRTAGEVVVSLGGVSLAANTTNSAFTVYLLASSTASLAFTPDTNFDGSISIVSVRRIAKDSDFRGTWKFATANESKDINFDDSLWFSRGIMAILIGANTKAEIYME